MLLKLLNIVVVASDLFDYVAAVGQLLAQFFNLLIFGTDDGIPDKIFNFRVVQRSACVEVVDRLKVETGKR